MSNLASVQSQQDFSTELAPVMEHLRAQFIGKEVQIELAFAALLAGGHLLLEGPPGTGKTSLASALANSIQGKFRRVQMTSDLLPSDITGVLRYIPGEKDFSFRPGPVFTNVLLADEINRCSPKTQSALFEAMAEKTVSVDGVTHALPNPFFVVATQNPFEFQGVYPLAESQLDRFSMQLILGLPDAKAELAIYQSHLQHTFSTTPAHALSTAELLRIRQEVGKVFVEESVAEYVQRLAQASREHARIVYGVSVRGALQLIHCARALAYVRGRNYVVPADIQVLAVPVLAHRLCLTDGDQDTKKRGALVQEILQSVAVPR